MAKQTLVIDLGGSIMVPKLGQINLKLLREFKKIIKKESKEKRFVIVIGGGSICRNYQKNARDLGINDHDSLDWIGIRSTQLNAEFLKSYLGDLAFPQLVASEKQKINWKRGVLISGGWYPGNSTDYIAVKLAKRYKAEKVIIATNIDYVYDSDPKKNPDAKKYENILWPTFNKMFKQKWEPGMTVPMDPKAAKLGRKIKIPLFFLNGNNMANLAKTVQGKKFKGTTIQS